MTYLNVEGGGSLETAFVLFQHRLHLFLQKLVHLNEKIVDRDQLSFCDVQSMVEGVALFSIVTPSDDNRTKYD